APPAPGLFSMTKGWPSCCESFSPTMRAARSVAWPGGQGMMTFTGLLGYCCANALPATSASAASKHFVMISLLGDCSNDFEKSRCSHPAADAHRDDNVLSSTAPAFDQRVAHEARTGDAVGVPDRDRAAVHVEALVR